MLKKIIKKIQHIINANTYTTEELIRLHGGKIGKSVFIGQQVLIDFDYCFLLEIGDGATISARTIIEFHDSCLPNVMGHGNNKIGKVKIGKRAYIGVNTVILPGTNIGNGAIVGACSLVNKDIPDAEVWGGIPAKFICSVEELQRKRKTSNHPDTVYLSWIGEIEKNQVNYPLFKKEFISRVRLLFESSEHNTPKPV